MINFMNYSLSTAAEGFVPSHAPLKNNKHLNILFSQLSRGEEKKSESQGLTPSSWVRACGTRRGSWGRASILSVMPNATPDSRLIYRLIPIFILGFHIGLQEEPILHCKVTFWPRYFQIGFALHRV